MVLNRLRWRSWFGLLMKHFLCFLAVMFDLSDPVKSSVETCITHHFFNQHVLLRTIDDDMSNCSIMPTYSVILQLHVLTISSMYGLHLDFFMKIDVDWFLIAGLFLPHRFRHAHHLLWIVWFVMRFGFSLLKTMVVVRVFSTFIADWGQVLCILLHFLLDKSGRNRFLKSTCASAVSLSILLRLYSSNQIFFLASSSD